uniref:Precursor of CEP14 n=1 Tax=Fagus sylvatica TaxID=28930 RepID=A0A2N9HNI2_FAGSY
MGRLSSVLLISLIVFGAFSSCLEGRRLLDHVKEGKKGVPSLRDRLFLSALPKGTVPSSTPSKKGHAVEVDEKLSRHLISINDRNLQSVPSPGVGH